MLPFALEFFLRLNRAQERAQGMRQRFACRLFDDVDEGCANGLKDRVREVCRVHKTPT